MANEISTSFEIPHKPLTFTPIGESWNGDKVTTTEAKRLTMELLEWASQFDNPDAKQLCEALRGFDRLFVRVWTEIDESLLRLALINLEKRPHDAAEHIAAARKYLSRWQDRGGRIGNLD